MSTSPLLRPYKMRGRWLRSRVVFGPHETNLARRRAIADRHVPYYARRARGGASIIVTEAASIHPWDWPYERAPLASDCVPGWEGIARACQPEGAAVLAGLSHAGGQGSSAYSQRELWAPSSVADVSTREVPKEMEPADIAAVVDGFAEAARLAVGAGLDGVEVNAGQYSLLRQFLSGLTNLRDDEYAQRDRLAREVLAAVRAAVGDAAIVGLRLSCDELAPWAGITPDAAAELAVSLTGPVDYVAVVRGSAMGTSATRPDGHTPPGFNLPLAEKIRTVLRETGADSAAVVAQGSIVDVEQAEQAVESAADFVEMTRALLADAYLLRKVADGDSSRVRPCILCNQRCLVRDPRNPIVSCVADPRTGHEWEEPTVLRTAPLPRDVLVVGGGPAGLEAARVAALRGHRVRLLERSDRLGGNLRVAAAGAGRERLGRLVDWLVSECGLRGVTVELGRTGEAAEIVASGAELILATGSVDGARTYDVDLDGDLDGDLEGDTLVISARALLEALAADRAADLPDGPVVVWDPAGGPIGVSVAETLVGLGRQVTFVTPDHVVGNDLARTGDLAPANTRLQAGGVTIVRRSSLRAVHRGEVTVDNRWTGERATLPAGLVVDAGFRLPDERLWRQLNDDTLRGGDEVAPRTAYEALLEARRAVFELEVRLVVRGGVATPPRPAGSAPQPALAPRSELVEGVRS